MNVGTESGADYHSFTGRGPAESSASKPKSTSKESSYISRRTRALPFLLSTRTMSPSRFFRGSGNDANALLLVEDCSRLLHHLAKREEVGEKALVLLFQRGKSLVGRQKPHEPGGPLELRIEDGIDSEGLEKHVAGKDGGNGIPPYSSAADPKASARPQQPHTASRQRPFSQRNKSRFVSRPDLKGEERHRTTSWTAASILSIVPILDQQFPPRGCGRCEQRTRSKERMRVMGAGLAESSDARLLELGLVCKCRLGRGIWAYHRRSAPLGQIQFRGEDWGNAGNGGPVILESTSSQEAYSSMRNEPRMTFQNSTRELKPARAS